MHPFSVIMKPLVSEKSNDLREEKGQYTFLVRREASKQDVSRAVAKLWDVKVATVRTMISRGKVKRRGSNFSKPTKTKKAIVTLEGDAKLPLFEDQ